MIDFKTFIEESEMELLDEAGNVSSGLAIRKHNQVLKYGKEVVKSKSIEDKLDMLARQNTSLGGLVYLRLLILVINHLGLHLQRV